MMTDEFIRQRLTEAVADPIAMANQMKLAMSDKQRATVARMARAAGRLDFEADDAGDMQRAVLLTTFWRTLRAPKGRSIILTPTLHERQEVMKFLTMIVAQDDAMRSLVSFPRWYKIQIAKQDDWELFVPTPRMERFVGIYAENLTVVALDDGFKDPDFRDVIRAAEVTCAVESNLFVQLWKGK